MVLTQRESAQPRNREILSRERELWAEGPDRCGIWAEGPDRSDERASSIWAEGPAHVGAGNNDFTEYQFLALINDTRDVLSHEPLIMCNIDALNPNSTG